MAKTVGDLLIKLGVDGIEGVTQLKSALTGLSKAAGPADAGLMKLGKAIKAFNRDGNASRDVIAGKLSALKSLRSQAGLNGAAFRALTKDIVDYQQKLAAADKQIDETTRKVSTLAQVSSQIPGRKAGTFGSQIAAFNEELKELSVTSDKYATVLRNIQERTRSFQRAQARQGVIAAGRTGAEGPADPRTAFEVTTELPRTTAALSLRLTELREDFANIAIGSKDYVNALREINSLESQIGDPFGTAARKQEIRGRLGQQEQFGMFAPRDPVQSAIARRERKLSSRYGGFAGGGMANQPIEASGLFKTIASIGSADTKAATEMMGRSLAQVTNEINRQAAASKGSINSLQAQRAAFAQLRAGLDPTSKGFQDVSRQIEAVDRRLEKINKRRRRPTIGGLAQGLGGVAAGGVFGGPEGAFGAAVGGAVGGVAGVAAGAALGAQVKMLREALGATSEYAAQLQKLEIALKGVAGPEYSDALKAANQVTKDFNVPLDVSTRGITRLSAAVIGAGGSVADAEVVFRNITSAIKATGGGAQDVESAITAMVQTFSKGKVSAEELSGQLGERLPGAVTKFAEANNMTLPELQKAFKAGTVGLDELMKFIISLGPEYENTARAIANSSADAGAKAAVAFDQVRREVGEALQPIGAELQEAFAEFALEVLPAIKTAAVAAASGIKVLMDATAALVANFKEILIIAGAAGITLVITNLSAIMLGLAAALGKATVAMKGFTVASLLNPWVALAAGIAAATVALVKYSRKNSEFNKSVIAGETSNKEANDRLREMNDKVEELQDRLETEGNGRMIRQLKNQLKAAKIAADDLSLAMKLATSYTVAGIEYDRMTGRPINAPTSYTPTDFDDPDVGDDTESGSARVMMTQAELDIRRKIREAQEAGNKSAASQYQLDLDILLAKQETEDAIKRTNDIEIANFNFRERGRDIAQQEADEAERRAAAEATRQDRIQQARVLAGEITQEEYNRKKTLDEMAILLKDMPELYEKIKQKLNEVDTPLKSFQKGLKDLFERSMDLKQALADRGVNAVKQFGDAFADMVVTGKANFAELTRSILQDLAKMFAKAALFKAISLIPGVGNFLGLGAKNGAVFNGSGTNPPVTMPDSVSLMAANGAAFAKNKIVPYAKGGLVTKPTLFQYANGGTGNFGIMGEAGPEAILPLKKGPGGKLGVHSSGAGASNIVVNVDASGSSVEGNEQESKALGKAIGAAVQAEIVKQKMPGGLLN
jgi:lambda family phage tail tape measure protein